MQDRTDKETKVISHWNWIALYLPILGLVPLLVLETGWLWNKPHLQFFPLTIVIVAWVAYQESKSENRLIAGWRLGIALFLVLLTIGISFAAMLLYSPWLAHVAVAITFFAWGLVRFSRAPWTRVVAIGVLLSSTVPLPLNWDQKLIGWLQNWSAKACGSGLDALQIPNFLQGNVIQIANHTLFVEEACSGVTSLYSLIALALIYSVLQRRSLAPSLLLLLVTPLVAINGNILRLLIIVLGFEWWNIDLTHGLPHDIVGISTFLISALALLCFAGITDLLTVDIPKLKSDRSLFRRLFNFLVGWPKLSLTSLQEGHADIIPSSTSNCSILISAPRLSIEASWCRWGLALVHFCIFLPLAVVFFRTVASLDTHFSAEVSPAIAAKFPGPDSLDAIIGDSWSRNGYDETLRELSSLDGQHSHTWRYIKGERAIVISLDFAFRGWHALEQCYRSSGWNVLSVNMMDFQNSPWTCVECNMSSELGFKGYLLYSLFDESGREYEINVNGVGIDLRLSKQTILDRFRSEVQREVPLTFQIQLFVESGPELTIDEKKEIRDLFVVIREQIRTSSMPAIQYMKGQ